MNTSRKFALAALVLAAFLSSPVQAHGGGHGGGHGHGWGWGWGWGGVALGAAVVSSAYWVSYPNYYGYPYPYSNPYPYAAPAPVYGQRNDTPPPQAMYSPAPAVGTWYFCRQSNAYYPYVKTCAAGWESVPAVPPGQ